MQCLGVLRGKVVRLPAGLDEESLDPGYDVAQRRNVIMTLSTGARIDGIVSLYGPTGYDRLSDYTRRAKHFRYVVTPFGPWYVKMARFSRSSPMRQC